MEGEERDSLRVEQVFLLEMVFIGLFSIKILSLKTRLIFIPFGSQNTKNKNKQTKTREEEKGSGRREKEKEDLSKNWENPQEC